MNLMSNLLLAAIILCVFTGLALSIYYYKKGQGEVAKNVVVVDIFGVIFEIMLLTILSTTQESTPILPHLDKNILFIGLPIAIVLGILRIRSDIKDILG